jgi:hypothetical protein
MLSLRRCRELLGPNCSLTDFQVESLRDEMSAFADILIDVAVSVYDKKKARAVLPTLPERGDRISRASHHNDVDGIAPEFP